QAVRHGHDAGRGLRRHPDIAAVQHLAGSLEADPGPGRDFLDRDIPACHDVLALTWFVVVNERSPRKVDSATMPGQDTVRSQFRRITAGSGRIARIFPQAGAGTAGTCFGYAGS